MLTDRSREVTGQVRLGHETLHRPQREWLQPDRSPEVIGQVMERHQTSHRLQRGGVLTDRSWEVTCQVMYVIRLVTVFRGEGC